MNSFHDSILSCINYLDSQSEIGYSEAIHTMLFPKIFSNAKAYDIYEGFIFQRALICEALLDVYDLGFKIDKKWLVNDANLLINSSAVDIEGGWRYFPSLYYLPPDADDLAQVLQVLLRTGIKIPEFVDKAIDLIFDQGIYPNGSFETWIVDRNNLSNVNKTIIWSIENMWGKGPDVEVMANLLYALNMYDYKKYEHEIKRGCKFIIASQKPSGYWDSSWYVDKYYSVFVCTRLISLIFPNNNCFDNTYSFLINKQRNNGSWGAGEGNPLQTSLVLLSLIQIMSFSNTEIKDKINKGVSYILNSQNENGFWNGSPFIEMNVNRALNQRKTGQPKIITYQSDTITSTFCLKALSAYLKILKD
jgi:squalene-hopene/tetraprenyl-beta-curcumene cyclase